MLNRQNIPVLFAIIFSIIVGLGSLLSGIYPILGIIISIFGIGFALWQLLSAEIKNREINRFFEAQACLMANAGIGNLYLQIAKEEFLKKGTLKNTRKYLDKALQLAPNDIEAILATAYIIIKELSFNQWLHKKISDSSLSYAFNLVNRGIKNYPNEHKFLDLLGVLYDIAGKHNLARKCFITSSKMRKDPYWRLLLSTSYGMAKDYAQSLEEMQKAIDEGAKGWFVEYYYGRALKACGYYREALTHLNNALSMTGYDARILLDRQNCLHMLGNLGLSAIDEFRVSLIVLLLNPSLSGRLLTQSITHLTIAILMLLSKKIWSVTSKIPIIRNIHCRLIDPIEPQFTLGVLAFEQGHFQIAREHFEKCYSLTPLNNAVVSIYAITLDALNEKEKAITIIEAALKKCPDNEVLLTNKATIESGDRARRLLKIDVNAARKGKMGKT